MGIDLSGDPKLGSFTDWKDALTVARCEGLKLTFHAGEIVDYEETQRLLDFEPDRLGHMCFVNEQIKKQLIEKRTPIEICLTSNLLTESVAELDGHHLVELYKAGHPVVICTDDPGFFLTTMTRECMLAADALKLDKKAIFELMSQAVGFAFCDEHLRIRLKEKFKEFEAKMAFS